MTSTTSSDPQEPFTRISVEQAWERVQKEGAVVVDVRSPDEWVTGHVKGAIHLPVDDVLARIDELPTGQDLLFICAVGVRSALACEMAAAMGRPSDKLFNIEEGTGAWINHNFPTSYNDEP